MSLSGAQVSLDHESFIPLYIQLASIIRQRIESGVLRYGEVIPTEHQLMEQFEVSRTTVREAVSLLVSEGLLVKKQGKGTLVQRPKVSEVLGRLTGFSEEIRARGMTPYARCLEADFVPASSRVAAMLGCPEEASVLWIYRLRLADGEPLAVEESFWPKHIGDLLVTHDLDAAAYYDVLESEYGVWLSSAEETIRAGKCSSSEAKLLDISPNSPLLEMERATLSANHGMIEYCRTRYRADRYDYRIRLKRSGSMTNGQRQFEMENTEGEKS